jgi:hypothetical protein
MGNGTTDDDILQPICQCQERQTVVLKSMLRQWAHSLCQMITPEDANSSRHFPVAGPFAIVGDPPPLIEAVQCMLAGFEGALPCAWKSTGWLTDTALSAPQGF